MAKTIAVDDDDADQRANYADAITRKGYQVAEYASRSRALQGTCDRFSHRAFGG